MKRPSVTRYLASGCLRAVGLLVLWSFWLVSAVVAIFLIRVAVLGRLEVPAALLERLRQEASLSGYDLQCGEAVFDIRGRVVLKQARAGAAAFGGAYITAGRLETSIDYWKLMVGDLRLSTVSVRDGRIMLPGLLSPTGTDYAIVDDLQATFQATKEAVVVHDLRFKLGNLFVTADGRYSLPQGSKATASNGGTGVPGAGLLGAIAGYLPLAERFENPTLSLHVEGDQLRAEFLTDKVRWPLPAFSSETPLGDLELEETSLRTSFNLRQLGSQVARVEVRSKRLKVGERLQLESPKAVLLLALADGKPLPQQVEVTASSASALTVVVDKPSLRLAFPLGASPADHALYLAGSVWGEPFTLEASGDPRHRRGLAKLTTHLSAAVFNGLAKDLHKDFTAILQPSQRVPVEVQALFGEGGSIDRVTGWFNSGPVVARHVALQAAWADFSLMGGEIDVGRLALVTESSVATGSYWMDTKDYRYRFLLEGHLQPADIAGWFKDWWPRFWNHFHFPEAVGANVDVQGRWGHPDSTSVFVGAVAKNAEVNHVPFDRVETHLLVSDHRFEGYLLQLDSGEGRARGSFLRALDPRSTELSRQQFRITSTLDLALCARLFGKEGSGILEPFEFERPPTLVLDGYFNGPGNPSGPGRDVSLKILSKGAFRFHRFPLQDFEADVHLLTGEVDLPHLRATVAGGSLDARANLNSRDSLLSFEGALKNANLGTAIQTVENHLATKDAKKSTFGESKFQQKIASGLLTLTFSGSGKQGDAYSYTGSGTATIKGAELGEINMLGELSKLLHDVPLLHFTTLSLNTVDSKFELKGSKVEFPYFRISGPSARISASGDYDAKAKKMSFDATLYPFAQNSNVFATAMGLVLTPLSAALELHLEGPLDDPKWHFALGPTGILRRISTEDEKVETPDSKPAQPPPLLRRH